MRRSCTSLLLFALVAVLAPRAAAQHFSLDNTSLDFSANAGTSPASQNIILTNNTGGSLKIALNTKTQSGGSWLRASISPNPVSGGGQATITVAPLSQFLQPNTYTGTLSVTDGSTKVNVSVSLTVVGVTISAPTSKNITLTEGTTGSVSVHVTGGPAALVVTPNVNWLSAGGAQAPGDVSIGVDASLIPVGSHSGGVSLQCAAGGSPCVPVFVFVTCNVVPSSSLKINADSMSFQAYQGRMDPPSQAFQVTTTDGSALNLSIVPNVVWLKATASSNVASSKPAVVTVNVTAAQLNPGTNMGAIAADASNGSEPVLIPVTATLSPFSISVMPVSPLAVTVSSGKTQTVPLQVATADGEPATLKVTAQTSDNHPWLQAAATIHAPANFEVTVDASQLVVGNYSGSLTFSCSDATCADLKLAVNVTVGVGSGLAPQVNAVVGAGLSVPPVSSLARDGLFTIFGSGFADASVNRNAGGSDLMNNALPTNLANTCVQGGNDRWGLIYVSAVQINAVANPLSTSGTIPVTVIRNCGQPAEVASAPLNVKVAAETPQFLFVVQNPNGKNEIVALEALSGVKVGPIGLIPGENFAPAHAGDILTAYGVGWGATTPAAVVGSLAAGAADITGGHKLTIGGKTAAVSYAGLAPSFAGLYQINFTVPSGLTAGNQPIVLTIDGVPTPDGAFLAVK